MEFLESDKKCSFKEGDQVKVQLIESYESKYRELYKGWTYDHGVALNGATGVIKDIKWPNYKTGTSQDLPQILVEFDSVVHYINSFSRRELTLHAFHFKEYELLKI